MSTSMSTYSALRPHLLYSTGVHSTKRRTTGASHCTVRRRAGIHTRTSRALTTLALAFAFPHPLSLEITAQWHTGSVLMLTLPSLSRPRERAEILVDTESSPLLAVSPLAGVDPGLARRGEGDNDDDRVRVRVRRRRRWPTGGERLTPRLFVCLSACLPARPSTRHLRFSALPDLSAPLSLSRPCAAPAAVSGAWEVGG